MLMKSYPEVDAIMGRPLQTVIDSGCLNSAGSYHDDASYE
jgi:hypothetical protein